MDTELTRQYSSPTPVSTSTIALYRQFRQPTIGSHGPTQFGNLPESNDLLAIKANLEGLLTSAETRHRRLRRDLNHLEKNVKIHDNGGLVDHQSKKGSSSGKNMGAILEQIRVKQERSLGDGTIDNVHGSMSKEQIDKEVALQFRRKWRKDELGDSTDKHATSRSASPHHIVKIKKLEGASPLTSRSLSPPSVTKPHHSKYMANKGSDNIHLKKKRSTAMHNNPTVRAHVHGNPSSAGKVKMNKNHEAATQDTDFIRVKPKDQVPILTFWQAVEPYFRPLAEADREFLLEKGDDTTPYSIPSLGQYYADVWAEGDISVGNRPHSPYTRRDPSGSNLKYLAPHRPLTEDCLMNNNLSCGRLTERLLSSLVKEDPLSEKELEELKADEARDWLPLDHDTEKTQLLTYPPEQVAVFEERLKRELRYAGLFNEEDTDWYAREDDQLCAELRQLGRELKEQAKINEFRKKRLLQVVDQQLQYEQYRQVLDTLDNQVDQCYMKRFRTQKSKKRKAGSTPKSTLSENAVYAMEKRRKWTTALGPIFNKKNCVMPTVSIYEDQSEDGLTNGQT